VALGRRLANRAERILADLAGALQVLEQVRPAAPPKSEPDPASTTTTLGTYQPQPGPQVELEQTNADEILFGGAAGPGKTTGSLGALRERVKLRGYRAIVFRRSSTHLSNALARAKEIYRDGRPIGKSAFAAFAPAPLSRFVQQGGGGTLHFPVWGSTIQFAHCHNDDDYLAHMGQEYDDIVFDEAPDFTRTQYENLISRRRGIVSGIVRRVIVTANPPEESQPGNEWIRQKWAPWVNRDAAVESWTGNDEGGLDALGNYQPPRTVQLVGLPPRLDDQGKPLPPARSGQVLYVAKDAQGVEHFSAEPFMWNGAPASRRTFIAATLRDNPALLEANPDYVQSLRNLDPVRRMQLEEGDWSVRRGRGSMFRREWFGELLDHPPEEKDVVARARCWDKAATEPSTKNPDPDWTRGLRGARLRDGTILIEHLASCREAPGKRDAFIKMTADQDGKAVRIRGPQDPAQGGVVDATAFRKLLEGFIVRTAPVSGNKVLRAGPASSMATPLPGSNHGRIRVLRGPWNEAFFAELEAFPEGGKDDIVDTLSDLHDELVNRTSMPAGKPPAQPSAHNPDMQPLGI
jgi:phage terminase large subunit-like protein